MSNSDDKCGKHLHIGKCCEHVNCCILLVWIQKTSLGKWKLNQKSSSSSLGLALDPLPSSFSHSHLRAQTKGIGPRDQWFALEPRLHGPRPQHTLASAHIGPGSAISHTVISPHGQASCKVLFCLSPVTATVQKNIVSNSLKWRHLHAILKIFVRVLIYCFDQRSLTCGQSSEQFKGKRPLEANKCFP